MKNKSKGVLITVLAVMLVLSVSYFALLAPTTAWFYQTASEDATFTFGDFDVTETYEQALTQTFKFNGTTRFADGGEILFDEVVHSVRTLVRNDGQLPAKVTVNVDNVVDDVTYTNTGLRWFIFKSSEDVTTATTNTEISKGEYKSVVESMLEESMTIKDYDVDFSGYGGKAAVESAYDEYNANPIMLLNRNNQRPVFFEQNEEKYVYIIFWIEHSDVRNTLENTPTTTLSDYGVTINFSATPNVDTAADFTIRNASGNPVLLNVKFDGINYSGIYTAGGSQYNTSNGNITIAAGASAVIEGAEVGAKYVISTSDNSIGINGATGTVGNAGATVTANLTTTTSTTTQP